MRASSHGLVATLLALVALSAANCAGPGPRDERSAAPPAPAQPEPPEYTVLAEASVFEGDALDVAGATPLSAVAFARLVLRDDAGALFDRLVQSEKWVPRLYGLSGLWFTDRERCLRLARELAGSDVKVPHQYGCIPDELPVRALAESMVGAVSPGPRSSPVDLFTAGLEWLREADPDGQDLEYWSSMVLDEERPEEARLRAARVLAYSFGRPGLEALLRLMPVLAADLRADVAHLRARIHGVLEDIPPWAGGNLDIITEALEGEERSVHVAALHALEPLLLSPRSRAASRALVPRLEALLGSYRRPDGGLPTVEDEAWIGYLLSSLRGIGGPAGPALARALVHPEPIVRSMEPCPDPWNLDAWSGETIRELARQLEHPEADVRASAIRQLCLLADPELPPPPPGDVIAGVERQLPAIRRALLTLDDASQDALRERLEGIPGLDPH